MIVYFADRYLNILGKASTGLPQGYRIINDVKTEDVDSGVATFEFDLKYNEDTLSEARNMAYPGNYLMRSYDDADEFYTIIDTEEDTSNNTIYVYAEDAGLDLLNDVYGEYTADKAYPISYYVEKYSKDSGFEIHINEIPNLTRTLSWDTDSTASERLLSIASSFGVEIGYSFDIEGLELKHRYINIYKQRGEDSGVSLRLNREIDKIVLKRSIANLATGYKVLGGTPEGADKPISLNGYTYDDGNFYVSGTYLFCREANKIWSRRYAEEGVNAGYICKMFNGTSTNQKTLCSQAIASLKKASQMEENYEVTLKKVPDDLQIGDTVYVIDNDGEMYLESRALKIEVRASERQYTVTLGEYLMRSSGIDPSYAIVDDEESSRDEQELPQESAANGIISNANTIENIWIAANLSDDFIQNDSLKYRKDGNRIDIYGTISPSEIIVTDTQLIIFTLPESMWPSNPIRQVMAGLHINHWVVEIDLNGNVFFSDYGVSENIPCPITEKLYINLSYYQ